MHKRDNGQQEPSCHCGEHCRHTCFWKQYAFLQKVNKTLPYELAVQLLGICTKQRKIHVLWNTSLPIFTAVLFSIVPNWKHPDVRPPGKGMWGTCERHTTYQEKGTNYREHTHTGKHLKNTALAEEPDAKDSLCVIPLMSDFQKSHIFKRQKANPRSPGVEWWLTADGDRGTLVPGGGNEMKWSEPIGCAGCTVWWTPTATDTWMIRTQLTEGVQTTSTTATN